MQVNVNGQVQDWPDDTPRLVAWDSSLLANPGAVTVDNRGCPPGYFCEYVADPWNAPYSAYQKVCRLMDASVTGPGASATIAQETAPSYVEQAIVNAADAAKTTVETLGAGASALASWALPVVLILGALFIFSRR